MRPQQREPRWADLPVHPAADMWPKMSEQQIAELAKDIKERGLQIPVVVFEDNTEEANGAKGPFPRFKLDGRGRDAALKILGIDDPEYAKGGEGGYTTKIRTVRAMKQTSTFGSGGLSAPQWVPDTDPYAFVLTVNAHRLHLTTEMKRQAIEAYRKANPKASNRAVGRAVGVDDKTVAKEQSKNAEIPQISTPHDRAKAEILKDPTATNVALGKLADVSDRLIGTVRRELEDAGLITRREVKPAAPKKVSKPKPKPSTTKRLTKAEKEELRAAEVERMSIEFAEWCEEHPRYNLAAMTTYLEMIEPKQVLKHLKRSK